ncbi:MAG: hypothetical protein ACLQGP_20065 [Isosphaeraceae bacterium]
MIDRHFFDNPSFLEYVRLLRDLHIAIREGWDETTEGEALRERMDDPGRWLSSGEIASLNGISADFYSLTDPHPVEVSPITAEVMTDLEEVLQARRSRDFSKALVLLRKHAGRIPPARLAYLRGSVWMEAGEYSIASAFLQRASALEPDNPNFCYLALQTLWKADPSTAAERARAILSDPEEYTPGLVLKAADILAHQPRALPPEEQRQQEEALIPFRFRQQTSGEAETYREMLGAGSGLVDARHGQMA